MQKMLSNTRTILQREPFIVSSHNPLPPSHNTGRDRVKLNQIYILAKINANLLGNRRKLSHLRWFRVWTLKFYVENKRDQQ